ncbi:MAG: GIY-YIG nuclease family protein [Bacteroidota bacterium]
MKVIFYTYILYSPNHNRYYIGQTNNVAERLIRHNKRY